MSDVNLWIALSQQTLDEFKDYRQALRNDTTYSGPMDQYTSNVLDKMSDQEVVANLFSTPTLGGKTYTLFSVYLPGTSQVQDAIDHLTTEWPDHFIVIGAWWLDGRQAGTQWELDVDGERTGNTTGTPAYPIPTQAYRIMPPVIVYDENGDVVSTTPASSNADLRDINLLSGQEPRRFVA